MMLSLVLVTFYREEIRVNRKRKPRAFLKGLWTGDERRETVRLDKRFPVNYRMKNSPKNRLRADADNISTGGLRLLAKEKLRPGSVLGLEIRIPDTNQTISVDAELVWINEAGRESDGSRYFEMGARFIGISDKQKNILDSVIKAEFSKKSG
jgi:c-di-GMP-binding flagellar brake protein YcgR